MKRLIPSMNTGLQQFSLFVAIGLINTAIDACLYWVLTRFGSMEPLLASAFSFLAGGLNSFLMNKHWTFSHNARNGDFLAQYVKFVLVSVAVLGLHEISLLVLHYGLGFPDLVAKGNGIAMGVVAGFLLNKHWVFRWVPSTT
jgi:putative flippase GtrA